MEFCEMLMVGLLLRGNAYAVMPRTKRGLPVMFPLTKENIGL
jgi:phage portal protein BeeE